MQERLQKILSARGICSRRKAEEYILKGLVTVNGEKAELGQKADPEIDTVEVDGSVVEARKDLKYYLLNKPIGIVTTNASMVGQKTLIDILPKDLQGKVFAVGRLDKETSGLLLLTNDGVLAYRLTHPKFDHEKEYEVEVFEPITDGAIKKLEKGITISGEKTKPTIVKRIDENKFSIALTEGKNRQIRRMCQKVGKPVTSLKRVRIMTLSDSSMKQGDLRELTDDERDELLKSVGI
ncbi:rRNA pseudouridine synthase [Candidatus Peregrinibacteria bacterium]|jgi:pseudouridine synthase|nr:rRNA pseudouridine synthase [Candidatus Peregrinibacteria bacterium]MBT4367704.1 rRNA pseudouridine synthase [Candidatus Peregrinibacteria bacterium]MBT7009915.1 rRNA pseudouridine synthase [Candidatus Peregrinibacteria bacterium]MBT7345278.1 rRNA pseudouridine synthase [Candidatus Peregrinibacteria bacterium]